MMSKTNKPTPPLITDMTTYILEHPAIECPSLDTMLVCKEWAAIIRAALKKGLYIAAIPLQQDPSALPTACFKWMTMRQKVNLPRLINRPAAHMKDRYSVRWADIIHYCRERDDIDLLPLTVFTTGGAPPPYDQHGVLNVFKDLFVECEQFRRHVFLISLSCTFHPVYLAIKACLSLGARAALSHLAASYYETFINDRIPIHLLMIYDLYHIVRSIRLKMRIHVRTCRADARQLMI
jgi:hypothetical protein